MASASDLTHHRAPLHALTGLRFFAAFYVVFYHSKLTEVLRAKRDPHLANFVGHGSLAVALFFLLSGFILAYTYRNRLKDGITIRHFFEARFARLYPVYAFSLLLTAAVHLSFPRGTFVAACLLMVQAWNPFNPLMWSAWNYVCWTLSVEAFFYLTFPWLQRGLEKMSQRTMLSALVAMLLLGSAIHSGLRGIGYLGHDPLAAVPLPLVRLPEFIAGVLLGNLFLTSRRSIPDLQRISTLTYVAIAVSAVLLASGSTLIVSFVLFPFALLIWGLSQERSSVSHFLSTNTMLQGGGISYAVYLLQAPAKDLVVAVGSRIHLNSANSRFGGTVLLLLAVSGLTYYMVEVPSRDYIRRFFARVDASKSVN